MDARKASFARAGTSSRYPIALNLSPLSARFAAPIEIGSLLLAVRLLCGLTFRLVLKLSPHATGLDSACVCDGQMTACVVVGVSAVHVSGTYSNTSGSSAAGYYRSSNSLTLPHDHHIAVFLSGLPSLTVLAQLLPRRHAQ